MIYVIMGIYLALMVGIAIYVSRKKASLNDFFLGGRNVGGWMTALSYGTSYFSAVMFVGYAGSLGYRFGISAMWIGIGNAIIGTLIAWLLFAKPTRSITHRLSVQTMPAFFEKRYQSKNMKIIAALIIFVFLVPYCSSVYQGLSYIFESTLGIRYEYCMIVLAVLTLLYLLVGGYAASSLSSVFQAAIMLVGVVAMVFFIINSATVGGVREGIAKIAAYDADKAKLFGGASNFLPLLFAIITTSVGTWGMPQMIHKFYAVKDDGAIKKGTVISTVFALIIAGGTYFVGSFGMLFTNGQIPIDPSTGAANPDMIMTTMLTSALPEVLIGVVVVLVFAASMSTLSSLVLASSSAISMDLVKGVFKKDMKEKKTLLLMRIMCAVFVVVSLFLALNKNNAILTLMSFSWGALSGSFMAPFLLGVRWKRTTKAGAYAGMLGGLCTTVGLALLLGLDTTKATMIATIAMGVSLLLTVVMSLCTKKFSEEHITEVFGA